MTNEATVAPGDAPARVGALLDALADTGRRRAALDAEEVVLLAEAVAVAQAQSDTPGTSSERDIPLRSLCAQIGAMWRISDRTVQRRMSDAVVVAGAFGATLAALAAGEISRAHLAVIVEAGLALADDSRGRYEAAVLEVARRETPGRTKPSAQLLAARLHPIPIDARHAAAAATRDVHVRDLPDGMAELIATLPAYLAHGIRDRLDGFARREIAARAAGGTARDGGNARDEGGCGVLLDDIVAPDTRGIGQLRADAFADLLLTGHATPEISHASVPEAEAIVAHVQVTVPVLTALGHDVTPASLVGRSPIDTATALRLARTAPGWDRVLTHPISGGVLAVDRYRPSEHLRRVLSVRDEHCRFPGCRVPVGRCDVDHTVAREHDGATEVMNLAHLCRRHHTLKHHSAWRVTQTPDGVLHWTSPLGRDHPDAPARTLVFAADGAASVADTDPPPF